jgi:hypothetical protein
VYAGISSCTDVTDDLQYSIHILNKTASEFSMDINAEKTRVMTFRGMEPIRSKICINNKTLKQQNIFNYLGYSISYEREKDLNIKAATFVKVFGNYKPNFQTVASFQTQEFAFIRH